MKIYTTATCPKCKTLKAWLSSHGYKPQELDMSAPENITDLRCSGVFAMSAPILEENGEYWAPDKLFVGEELQAWVKERFA